MNAACWYGARDIRVEEASPRPPSAGEVQVRVECAGICASDLHEYTHGPQFIPTSPHPGTGRCAPIIMGHEFTGTVAKAGSDVKGLKEGDRIVAEASIPCGKCSNCKQGQYILCRQAAYLGFAWDGAFAEYCTLPAVICHRVPDGLNTEQAVLVEPLASALHAVRRSRLQAGETVAIIGTGTIGLGTLLCARAAGASRVFTCDLVESKRKLSVSMGAEQAFDSAAEDAVERVLEATGGRGVDVAFECVGSARTIEVATRCTRPQGRTVVVGVMVQPEPFSFLDILVNEREVIGTAGYCGEFAMAMALLLDGRIEARPLITSRIDLQDIAAKGFEPFAAPGNSNIKIVVRP